MATESIGERLRAARLARGLSLRGLAQSLGVSASLISQIETGKTQPSVSTLYAIVTTLGISIDDLLDVGPFSSSAAPTAPIVQRRSENPLLEMENGVRWERLAVGEGTAEALLVTYEPGAASSVEGRLMRHAGTEYALILEGELTLQVEFDTFTLQAGDSLHFDSSRPHLYSNRSDRVTRGVWFVAGRREQNAAPAIIPSPRPGESLSSAVDVLQAMDRMRDS